MTKSNKTDRAAGGLMSSAGLATYYDAEDESIAFDPRTVMLIGVISAIVLSGANIVLI